MTAFDDARATRYEQIRAYWERALRREDLSLTRRIPQEIWQVLMDAEAAGVDVAELFAYIDTTTPAERIARADPGASPSSARHPA